MQREELKKLQEAEQLCRELLKDTENECAKLIQYAKEEAEKEYKLLIADAYQDGEIGLNNARTEMERQKQAYLLNQKEEVRITCKNSQSKINNAVIKISERMCGGYDSTNEPFQPSSIKKR